MRLYKIGYAKFKGKKLCFDEIGWSLIKKAAKKVHTTPKKTVLAALRRSVRLGYFSKKG